MCIRDRHEIKLKLNLTTKKLHFNIRGKNFTKYNFTTGIIDDGMDPFVENEAT